MELRELLIDEEELNFGVEAISLVKYPAIEENFVYFSKQYELAQVDEERQMIVGPALIPNKKIYRESMEGEGYEVFFTPETVQKAAHLFMRQSKTNAATVEHETSTDDVYLYESWLVEDPKKDKQQLYGFNFPAGTWMVAMKVDDEKLWKGIKEGKMRGLSIEGYFVDKLVEKPTDNKSEMKHIFETIRSLQKRVELFAEDTLQDGTKIVTEADSFEVGVKVQVLDEEGNPQDAPTGEHTLQNGTVIRVGEGSILEQIGKEEAPEEPKEELAEEKKEEEKEEKEELMDEESYEKIKAIVKECIAEIKAEEAKEAEKQAEEAVEVVEALEEEKDEKKEEMSSALKQITDVLEKMSSRLDKIEDAPAANFSHQPTPKKEIKSLDELSIKERVLQNFR
jgi:ribosomal protein S20